MPRPSFFRPLMFLSKRADESIERSEVLLAQVQRLGDKDYDKLANKIESALSDLKAAKETLEEARKLEKEVRSR